MILLVAVPLTVFISVLQVAAAPSFTYLTVHPDLYVPWLCCWATIRGRDETLVLTGVAGLSLGLLAPEPLGASLLALLPIAVATSVVDLTALPSRYFITLGMTLIAGLLYPVLLAGMSYLGGDTLGPPLGLLRIAPRVAILDMVTAALWYWPLRLAFAHRSHAGRFRRA
jgi:hypothetical protein